MGITHSKVSAKSDGADSSLVLPSDWNASHTVGGSSFPVGPATNEIYFRTDLGAWFYFDGTRWLSTTMYIGTPTAPTAVTAFSGSANAGSMNLDLGVGTDIWLISCRSKLFVASGGTALGASHNWVCSVVKSDVNNASTTLITITLNSGSSSVWRTDTQTINALYTPGTYYRLSFSWAKTGTPGNLTPVHAITYRIVAT